MTQYIDTVFENAGVSKENLYLIYFLISLICCLTAVLTIPLIDQLLGRKPLLVCSYLFTIIDLILFIIFMALKVILIKLFVFINK
jgi:hypothetical protein